jgi:hypothetical protein
MNVNGNRIVANLAWNEEAKNFNIVGKATEKRSLDAMQDDFRNNRVSEFSFTLNYRYAEDNFHRAVLRAAYLVLFEHLGYSYAQQDIVQSLRQRISDGALSKPDLGSIIIGLEAAKLPNNQDYLVVQSRLKGREFFLVIIRAQGFSTSYVGAFFPSESGSISDFVSLLDRLRESNNGGKMTISLPDQSSTSC